MKHVPLILKGFLLPQMKEDKSSTVAEMGDPRLFGHNGHGLKSGGCCPHSVG